MLTRKAVKARLAAGGCVPRFRRRFRAGREGRELEVEARRRIVPLEERACAVMRARDEVGRSPMVCSYGSAGVWERCAAGPVQVRAQLPLLGSRNYYK
eukprot:4780074-Pyramimonas_sp.AAC.1